MSYPVAFVVGRVAYVVAKLMYVICFFNNYALKHLGVSEHSNNLYIRFPKLIMWHDFPWHVIRPKSYDFKSY